MKNENQLLKYTTIGAHCALHRILRSMENAIYLSSKTFCLCCGVHQNSPDIRRWTQFYAYTIGAFQTHKYNSVREHLNENKIKSNRNPIWPRCRCQFDIINRSWRTIWRVSASGMHMWRANVNNAEEESKKYIENSRSFTFYNFSFCFQFLFVYES